MQLKGVWAEKPYYIKFLVFISVVTICSTVGFVLWMASLPAVFGINFMQNPSILADFSNPKVIIAYEAWQTLQGLVVFILPAWLTAYMVSKNANIYLHIQRKPQWIILLLVIILMLAALPLSDALAYINNQMTLPPALKGLEDWMKEKEQQAALITQAFLTVHSFADLLFKLLMIAVLPAIGEEFVFRGILQRLFNKWLGNKHAAIIITAILFSAMHIQFYGFLPRFAMGVCLGYLLVLSGSLWVAILAHFVNNGAAVVMAYYNPASITDDTVSPPNVWLVLLSIATVTAMLVLIRKKAAGDALS